MKKVIFMVETILYLKQDAEERTEYFLVKMQVKDLLQYDKIDFKQEVSAMMPDYIERSIRKFEIKQVQYLTTTE